MRAILSIIALIAVVRGFEAHAIVCALLAIAWAEGPSWWREALRRNAGRLDE